MTSFCVSSASIFSGLSIKRPSQKRPSHFVGYSNCPRYFASCLKEGLDMRPLAKRTVVSIIVLIAFTTASIAPYAHATGQSTKAQKKQLKPQTREKRPLRRAGKDYKVKKGAEVAAKVRKLKESSKSVRAALRSSRIKSECQRLMRHSPLT